MYFVDLPHDSGNSCVNYEILVVTSAYVRTFFGGEGEGREGNQVSARRGGVCYIFLAGNRAMHLCNPAAFFSWREIAQEMAWPLSSRSKTCLPLVFNYFIAEGFCDRSAQFLVNCF